MIASIFLRQALLIILTLTASFAYAQANNDKIKAKWVVDKFEVEASTPQAVKARQELQGSFLTFGDELVISKSTNQGELVIKKGQYIVSGTSITLEKDEAEIIELSEKHLTIKIPKQGILYLTKM